MVAHSAPLNPAVWRRKVWEAARDGDGSTWVKSIKSLKKITDGDRSQGAGGGSARRVLVWW